MKRNLGASLGYPPLHRFGMPALALLATAGAVFFATDAHAEVDAESQFVLNSFAFLVWGALVMWMCAGFTMLESGTVKTKNASVICLKNIGLYSIARPDVLHHRLQPDVHRCHRLDRLIQLLLRHKRGRDRPLARR